MEGKTPVTVLQELLVKRNIIPVYNLIVNGVGTHEPVFEYEVIVGGDKATGSGKSKKEAKQNAAFQFLQALKKVDSTIDRLSDDVVSPYEGILKDNAVGELQDFCVAHQLMSPEYKLIGEEGLSHVKVYYLSCTVSSFTTQATARTKRDAKRMVAVKMLRKLKECMDDIIVAPIVSPAQLRNDEMDDILDKVIERMPASFRKLNFKGNHNLNLKDVCYTFTEENMPGLDYLDSIKNNGSSWFNSLDKGKFQHIFSKIAVEIDSEYTLHQIDASDENIISVVLTIDSKPSWTFVAAGETLNHAKNAVFEEAVKFMVKMRL